VPRMLICLLPLLLCGCLQNDSSGSETSPPANAPGSGNSGDENPDSNDDQDGNANPPQNNDASSNNDPDCNWNTDSAIPLPAGPTISLGNTGSESTYDISSFSERTDLNSDLTGTWVLMHKVARQRDDSTASGNREWTESWNKFVFVIRDTGSGPEAASCLAAEFVALGDTSGTFPLPLFSAGSVATAAEAPQFSLDSNSRMSGTTLSDFRYDNERKSISFLSQSTTAVKISAAVSSLGSHTLNMTYGPETISESNDAVWCIRQLRELSQAQTCAQPMAEPALLLLAQSTAQQGLAALQVSQQTVAGENSVGYYQLYSTGSNTSSTNYLLVQEATANTLNATFSATASSNSYSLSAILSDGKTWNNSAINASSDYSLSVP